MLKHVAAICGALIKLQSLSILAELLVEPFCADTTDFAVTPVQIFRLSRRAGL